jgi:hypothetical protein
MRTMGVTKFVSVIICLLTVGALFLHAENPAPPDIEQTHAFLVKLKSGKTTRSLADDDWQMTPLTSEAQTRSEAVPSGNWWYLSEQSREALELNRPLAPKTGTARMTYILETRPRAAVGRVVTRERR